MAKKDTKTKRTKLANWNKLTTSTDSLLPKLFDSEILGEGTNYYMSIKRIIKRVQRNNRWFAVSFIVWTSLLKENSSSKIDRES